MLKNTFDKVGYSDHTIGLAAPIYAISHGCIYVEKHFTTNRNLPGRDNKFSIMPDDLTTLCSIRDDINTMTQTSKHNYVEDEEEMRKVYRGRWGR
jgi:sialic acid synthase SpsE